MIILSFYQAERRKHINDVYPEAREYFVLNDMVFFIKLCKIAYLMPIASQ